MNSVTRTILAFAFLLISGPVLADAKTEITTALDYFVEIWNEGDLDELQGYYHPDFILVTENGSIAQGQRIDDLKSIAQAGEDRGVLEYTHIQIKPLEKTHALAWGEIHLKFKDGSAINSWFTTVYVKTPFGWKAILTHN